MLWCVDFEASQNEEEQYYDDVLYSDYLLLTMFYSVTIFYIMIAEAFCKAL